MWSVASEPAVDRPGLQDRIADRRGVRVREHVVVRQDERLSARADEAAERAGRDIPMPDAHAAGRRAEPPGRGLQCPDAPGLDHVGGYALERGRNDVSRRERRSGKFAHDRADDAQGPRPPPGAHLVADAGGRDVRACEEPPRGLPESVARGVEVAVHAGLLVAVVDRSRMRGARFARRGVAGSAGKPDAIVMTLNVSASPPLTQGCVRPLAPEGGARRASTTARVRSRADQPLPPGV